MVERTARGRKRPLQIFQDVVGLQLDIGAVIRKRRIGLCLCWHAGLEIGSELAGRENQIANTKGFRVVRNGFRIVRSDRRDLHVFPRSDRQPRVELVFRLIRDISISLRLASQLGSPGVSLSA